MRDALTKALDAVASGRDLTLEQASQVLAIIMAGDAEEAEHHLERARGAAAEAGREWLVLMAVAHLALLGSVTSKFARSARLAGDAIALAESRGWDRTWPAGAAYLALAGAEFLWDRGDEAMVTLEHARVALSGTQEPPLRAFLALLRATAGVLAGRGVVELRVSVLTANLPARAFYEALGAAEVGTATTDEEGHLLPTTVYEWADVTVLAGGPATCVF